MGTKKKHANIPIFIPHLGCPNNCVFCNQRSISGHMSFDENTVPCEIERALSTIESMGDKRETEIAFFGGSFTGIDRTLMISLLETAYSYVKSGRARSIRLSTRPDYIDEEILEILKKYGVRTVELGLQSMSEKVLLASKRGHSREQAEKACILIKEYGFELIGQMMIGLPSSTVQDEIETAERICALGADGARVYPTVVFYDTELCDMAERGDYAPLTDEAAVLRTKNVLGIFDKHGVPCIRVGLCASENLSSDERVYGGANHSAIGELAMGELFYDKMCSLIENLPDEGEKNIVFYVPTGATSKAVGQKKKNINRIKDKYFVKKHIRSVKILEKNTLLGYNIKMEI
ncbi:MAG: radical SAM protein [Ruminococcaceae bacterium]|nr:radical SAM protein [Oscillospiraceae bacterium]